MPSSLPAGAFTSAPLSETNERGLLVARALYFMIFAAIGAFFPYINIYYRSVGLSGLQIGFIGSLSPLVGIFAGPLWGLISDRLGAARPLVMAGMAGAVLSMLGLSLAPTFAWILLAAAAFTFFGNPVTPLLDSTTLGLLGERKERYGEIRSWGSVGFVLTSWSFGYLLERAGLHWLFYGYVALMSIGMVLANWLPARRTRLGGPLRSGLVRLIRQRTWLVFSASLFVLGLANSGMNTFLNIYVNEMGGGEGLVGLIWSVAALSEVPVMFLAAPIMARVGTRRLLMISYLLFAVRWLLYGIMPSPLWALPIGLLQGGTFGALWVAGVAYADSLAPSDLKATAQGLFSAVLYSLSGIVGTPISGLLFDTVGPAVLFRIYTVLGVIALGLLWWGTKGRPPSTVHE